MRHDDLGGGVGLVSTFKCRANNNATAVRSHGADTSCTSTASGSPRPTTSSGPLCFSLMGVYVLVPTQYVARLTHVTQV